MGEIKSRFHSIAIWIATKIRFKHCTIRFKNHAIWYWFDSNFHDSIQETRDLNRNLEVMVEIEYSFSLLTTQSDLIFKCLVLPITDVSPQ